MQMPQDEITPFNRFIGDWRAQHLHSIAKGEVETQSEALAAQLTADALAAGFRSQLTNACGPYRSMAAYIVGLHDVQASEHSR